jgi:hypothetical protein
VPQEKIAWSRIELPDVRLMRHQRFRDMLLVAQARLAPGPE